MVRYGMVRSMVRTGPPRLARDNGQGQGGHAGNVLAPPERGRGVCLQYIAHPASTKISFILAQTRALYIIIHHHRSTPKTASSLVLPY